MHFDLVACLGEDRRPASGTEVSAFKGSGLTGDRHRLQRINGGCVKQRAVVLAAVETMAQANTIRLADSDQSDIAAKSPAGKSFHKASPSCASLSER